MASFIEIESVKHTESCTVVNGSCNETPVCRLDYNTMNAVTYYRNYTIAFIFITESSPLPRTQAYFMTRKIIKIHVDSRDFQNNIDSHISQNTYNMI